VGIRLPKTKGKLRRVAASWLARLQSDRDPDVQRKFHRWRDADPRHAAAFDRVNHSYGQAGLLRHSPLAGSSQLQPIVKKQEWTLRPALAAAAAIVILVPAGVMLFRDGNPSFGGTEAVMLMTSVGEIKQVDLADGSKVTLDTATKVELEIDRSHRSARLRHGRARFQIAQASAPFVVETASTTISAREGVIDVEHGALQDRVEVLAGTADVRGAAERQTSHLTVAAGESATIGSDGSEQKSGAAPVSDWTRGMLQFEGMPLAEAVALANRYSERQIILTGDLNAMRVTGAFRAGDTAGLAKGLAAAFNLSLQQRADGNLVLSRKASTGTQNKRGG
jgi:transmembrane sensor